MALFEMTHYGSPISEKMADILMEWTTTADRADAAQRGGVHPSTMRNIIYRTTSLTIENEVAVQELCRIAFNNCMRKGRRAKEDLDYMVKEVNVTLG